MFRTNRFAYIFLAINFIGLSEYRAQEGRSRSHIEGLIIDGNSENLPYASVSLYRSVDSTLVIGVAAGTDGRFNIPAVPGSYIAKVSFLSFQDRWIGPFVHGIQTTALGRIEMELDNQLLDEVQIYSEREAVEFKLDKRVFNIQKDLTNRGRNASDILDNLPSVAVNLDGNVSLRGSENVRLLIDGKPSGLIGLGSADALRQLQGDIIESIEIITNPSSKYESEGEVGIINIILKKERKNGVNGSVDLNAGIPDLYGAALNLNFRKKAINLFMSGGVNFARRPGYGRVYQEFNLPDTSYYFDNRRDHERGGLSGNFRLGSEFFMNAKNTLTISGLVSKSIGDNELTMLYQDFSESGAQTQRSERKEKEEEDTRVIEIETVYLRTFDSDDHKLNISFKGQERIDLEDASIQQDFSSDVGQLLLQRSENKENEQNLVFQADYERPFSKESKLELGLRAGMRNIVNDFRVEEFDSLWSDVPGFVNELSYDENIYAAYASYGNENGKFGYQLGLRSEYTDIRTELKKTNEINPRDYLNLFPTLFLSYEYSDVNALQFSYSRRINRPRFWSLVPFYGFSDPRNFYSGNPNLDPEYVHSVELNRLTRSDKGSLISGIYARYKQGVIVRIVNVAEAGTTTFPINLGTGLDLGAEVSGNYSFNDWWRVNGSINLFREQVEGEKDGRDYGYQTAAMSTRINSKWTIKKSYDTQASITYRSPQRSSQGRSLSLTAVDLGLSKDILKEKGTLTLSVRDIFNTRKRRSIVDQEDYYSETEFQWRSRVIQLSFNYRINQKKKRAGREGDFQGDSGMDM